MPGIGPSTCVVTDVGVDCTASGPGGSVIMDGGIGPVYVPGPCPSDVYDLDTLSGGGVSADPVRTDDLRALDLTKNALTASVRDAINFPIGLEGVVYAPVL